MKRQLNIQRWLKKLDAGLNAPGHLQRQRESLIGKIEERIAQPDPVVLRSLRTTLRSFGLLEGAVGVVSIWRNDPKGWEGVQTCLAYLGWHNRIETGSFQRGLLTQACESHPPNEPAICLAHAIATQQDRLADFCGRTLLGYLTTGRCPYVTWVTAFEPYMVHLYARWRKLATPVSAYPYVSLGPYQGLFEAWDQDEAFASAVVKVCDYHGERSIDSVVAHAEFTSTPYDVFPAEILAIKRVREEEGLPWPEVKHPLLDTPLFHTPDPLPVVQNDLLDRVSIAVRAVMPEVAE